MISEQRLQTIFNDLFNVMADDNKEYDNREKSQVKMMIMDLLEFRDTKIERKARKLLLKIQK